MAAGKGFGKENAPDSNSCDVGMISATSTYFSEACPDADVLAQFADIDLTPRVQVFENVHDLDIVDNDLSYDVLSGPSVTVSEQELFRMNPFNISSQRSAQWPILKDQNTTFAKVYDSVRASGLPNVLGARIPLTTSLNISSWYALSTAHPYDDWLIEMMVYGFPLQYIGDIPRTNCTANHSSACRFPDHVNKFIRKELSEGAMIGPFDSNPFHDWSHVNPLMTRPKSNGSQRIIVDLAYPEGVGVNSAVVKNYIFGKYFSHRLPTIDHAIAIARAMNFQILAAVIDIERAYRNYRADPLDWPLLVIAAQNQYYIDIELPFGARLSSLYVQKIAEFITRALAARDIQALVYLDDIYLLLPEDQLPHQKFAQAMTLIRALGLPINFSKLITPAKQAIWLGVCFDFNTCKVSIPDSKVTELLLAIDTIATCQFVKYSQAQSIIGRIAHVARVIPAARLFMARILQQLRCSDGKRVYINHAVLADFHWFRVYFKSHNASSIINNQKVAATIEADSSLVGGGAWSGAKFYAYKYPPKLALSHNICQLEGINYLIALRAFVSKDLMGSTVELVGDNQGAIAALASNRPVDSVLMAISRAIWFHAAKFQIRVVFTHKNGEDIPLADYLSRVYLSHSADSYVRSHTAQFNMNRVNIHPAMHNYSKYI